MEEKEKLLNGLKIYKEDEQEEILKALNLASKLHHGQLRQSGEPYIIHPIAVSNILMDMHADAETICAGLLHDTLEDTNISKEDIIDDFNENVANLVDGVTKISKLNFSSKKEQNAANTRKIILGLTNDVRIIIIKLADRLHNMRTLMYKSGYKQQENALETMEIFVPLAYYIGAYNIKSELEDLSMQYLKPDAYQNLRDKISKVQSNSNTFIYEMLENIRDLLMSKNINPDIKFRIKNIYGVYKKLENGYRMSDIHDLFSLKIMVDDICNCYLALGCVHSLYRPVNARFKDYICNPKTNRYQSLHTTVFAPDDVVVQTQIRTREMDLVAKYGLTAYYRLYGEQARVKMQNDLREKYQFFNSLIEINKIFGDNEEFVSQVKKELFANKIYVYTTKGDIIELPAGSTVIDFAYKIGDSVGNTMIGAQVNGIYVDVDYVLNNKDKVRILTDDLSYGPREEWLNLAKTSTAKDLIRKFRKYSKE